MRIFIGYGYNERDKWVEDYAVPLVKAFECEVVHGKAVYGGALPDEVLKSIRTSDAMIGFTTRRDAVPPDQWRTHDWVVQEIVAAHSQDPRVPFVEVREQGVISPGGILEAVDAQRIDYRQVSVTTVRLGPVGVVDQIIPFLDENSFTCKCQTRVVPLSPLLGLFQCFRSKEA